jgi:hypothetical protein
MAEVVDTTIAPVVHYSEMNEVGKKQLMLPVA